MDERDREILRLVQDGIELTARPFARIADALALGEDEVLGRLQRLTETGVVRRFGARINPRKAEIVVNAMVVWRVPPDRIERVGALMAEDPGVTHCYERRTVPGRWEYALYTVVHGYDTATVTDHIRKLADMTGIRDYHAIVSTEEYKRGPNGRID